MFQNHQKSVQWMKEFLLSLGIHESKYEGFLAWQDSLTSKGSHKALKEVILPSVPGLMEKLGKRLLNENIEVFVIHMFRDD